MGLRRQVERKAEYMFIGLGDLHAETACGTATLATGTVIGGGSFCVGHIYITPYRAPGAQPADPPKHRSGWLGSENEGTCMRNFVSALIALVLSTSATFGADPVGTYEISGTNPGVGSKYSGTAVIQRTGDTFQVKVTMGGRTFVGIGIGKSDYLAVSYALGINSGIAVYTETESGWSGIWAPAGSPVLGTETWRRVSQ
jgi:hypothetical protein